MNGIDESWIPRLRPAGAAVRRGGLGRQAGEFGLRPPAVRLALSRGHFRSGRARLVHQKASIWCWPPRTRSSRRRPDHRHRHGEPPSSRRWSTRTRRPDAIGVVIGFNDGQPGGFCRQRLYPDAVGFEPCGLSQMYAQRFGSLPIATRRRPRRNHHDVNRFLFDRPRRIVSRRRQARFRSLKAKTASIRCGAARCRGLSAGEFGRCYSALYRKALQP